MISHLLIIGTGLMGGSVAAAVLALGKKQTVWGVDPQAAGLAESLGLLHKDFKKLEEALEAWSSLLSAHPRDPHLQLAVIIAAPMPAVLQALSILASRTPSRLAWITELSSAKADLLHWAKEIDHAAQTSLDRIQDVSVSDWLALGRIFVPSHPMAGAETSGPESAKPRLFASARVLISPLNFPFFCSSDTAVKDVEGFWRSLSAQPSLFPLQDHDSLLAAISHFPHIVAYALANMLANGSCSSVAQTLHGGGLRDTTRISASPAELWAEIILQNRDSILGLLPQWQRSMDELIHAIEANNVDALRSTLQKASHWRQGFLSGGG